MHAGLHRPDRHAEQLGDLLQRQVAQEVQRQRLPLRQRELVECVVNLLGVVERGHIVVQRRLQRRQVSAVTARRRDLVIARQAQPADRVVAGGAVQECRQRARVADRADRAEHLQPRLLEQVPGVLFGRGEPPQVVKEGPFPHRDDALERRAVPPLAAVHEQGAFEDLLVGEQRVPGKRRRIPAAQRGPCHPRACLRSCSDGVARATRPCHDWAFQTRSHNDDGSRYRRRAEGRGAPAKGSTAPYASSSSDIFPSRTRTPIRSSPAASRARKANAPRGWMLLASFRRACHLRARASGSVG